jgi:hypothetical protein
MKSIKLSISNAEGQGSFDLELKVGSIFGLEGNWGCTPGYLQTNAGYFELNSEENDLLFWDRDLGLGETLSIAVLGSAYPNKLFMSLKNFPDNLNIGQSGKGSIYRAGLMTNKNFRDRFNLPTGDVVWKIKQVI